MQATSEVFDRKEASRLSAVKRRVLRTGVGARDETQVTLQGSRHYLDVMLEPIRGRRQGIAGLMGAYFDVTPLKRHAIERERMAAQLQAALDEGKAVKRAGFDLCFVQADLQREGRLATDGGLHSGPFRNDVHPRYMPGMHAKAVSGLLRAVVR